MRCQHQIMSIDLELDSLAVDCVTLPVHLTIERPGLIDYQQAMTLLESKMSLSQNNRGWLFILQHPLVYTSGLKTQSSDIINPALETVTARRGGSVTLHNPGQLVIYTVYPVDRVAGGLAGFLRLFEGAMLKTLLDAGFRVFRLPGYSGIFTSEGKVGFIGLGLKKKYIYHGISLNICNDLLPFQFIYSCGLPWPVTRLCDLQHNNHPQNSKKNCMSQFFQLGDSITQEMSYRLQRHYVSDATDFVSPPGIKTGARFTFHEKLIDFEMMLRYFLLYYYEKEYNLCCDILNRYRPENNNHSQMVAGLFDLVYLMKTRETNHGKIMNTVKQLQRSYIDQYLVSTTGISFSVALQMKIEKRPDDSYDLYNELTKQLPVLRTDYARYF